MPERLLALSALSVLLLGHAVAPADDAEDRAVEAVKKLGGKAIRDEMVANKPVIAVFLSGTKVTDWNAMLFGGRAKPWPSSGNST